MAKEKNLVSIAEFARQADQSPQYIGQLTTPAKIEVVVYAGKKFIDTSIYNPNDFKPKPKEEKT